jgi:hypothetical protein
MRRPTLPLFALCLTAALGLASPACTQPRAGQHGAVTQTVNTTDITLEYDRPVLRGRSVCGDLLDYDVVWTPGANRARWIDLSEPVTVQGAALEAGRYGIWSIPLDEMAQRFKRIGMFHIKMFAGLPGTRSELIEQLRRENGYYTHLRRQLSVIFTRDSEPNVDAMTPGLFGVLAPPANGVAQSAKTSAIRGAVRTPWRRLTTTHTVGFPT